MTRSDASRVLPIILSVLSLLLMIFVYKNWEALTRLAATAQDDESWQPGNRNSENTGRVTVWIYNPWVSPGDQLAGTVVVQGGYEAAIDRLEIHLGSQQLIVAGPGPTWKATVTRSRGFLTESVGNATQDFVVDVPVDAAPGEMQSLRCDVRYTLAQPSVRLGAGNNGPTMKSGFENSRKVTTVEVPLTIQSHDQARVRWWLAILQALVVPAFSVAVLFWGIRRLPLLAGGDANGDLAATCAWLGPCASVVFVLYCFLGYSFFVLPLLGATLWTGQRMCWFLMLTWVLGPLFMVAILLLATERKGREELPGSPGW